MGLEVTTTISGLVATNPVGATDTKSQGDDHLRLIKNVLKTTFPNFTGVLSSSHTAIDAVVGGTYTSTDAGAAGGPTLLLDRNSASPAVSDNIGIIVFRGRDAGGAATNYASIFGQIGDPVDLSEDGSLLFQTLVAGANSNRLILNAAGATFLGDLVNSGSITGSNLFIGNTAATLANAASGTLLLRPVSPVSSSGQASLSSAGLFSAPSFAGVGTGLTSLPAAELTGTVASARIAGSYTGITGTGALDAGSITSGFGAINNGASGYTTTGAVSTGSLTSTLARLTNITGVTLASTLHAFQIGASNAANLAMDSNAIMARNNGATATLFLNDAGGNVETGGALVVNGTMASQIVASSGNVSGTTGTFSGAVSMAGLTATTGTFSSAVSMTGLTATTGAFSGAVSGTSGTFSAAVSGTTISASTAFRADAGSAAVPSLSFTADTNTGFYNTADAINITTGGVFRGNFNNTAFNYGRGSVDPAVEGVSIQFDGQIIATTTAETALILNRIGSDGILATFRNDNVDAGFVDITGANTVAYLTTSDETKKDFIGNYDPKKAIEVILADPVREFNWKTGAKQYAVGWGAQTSVKVSKALNAPMLASGGEGKPWGVDVGWRTPYLWAALTEVLARLETLEKKEKK